MGVSGGSLLYYNPLSLIFLFILCRIWKANRSVGIMFKVSSPSISQVYRNIVGIFLMFTAVSFYFTGLDSYLSGLTNPLPMKFVLGTSLVIAILYSLKNGLSRQVGIEVIATTIIFALASFLSIEYREAYLAIVNELKSQKGLEEVIGVEYVRAVENRAVGIGACFAMGLASIRLPFNRLLSTALKKLLVLPASGQSNCPHCGQLVNSN